MRGSVGKSQGEGPKGRPGRKRLGDEVFVPVTMKVEPSELATIESIAKYSGRSRSDVMREMLSYGLAHVMKDTIVAPRHGHNREDVRHAGAVKAARAKLKVIEGGGTRPQVQYATS